MSLKFQSFCAEEGVTVFVPEGFDPVNHLPSPVFVRDLCPRSEAQHDAVQSQMPKPAFKRLFGKSIAVIETGGSGPWNRP